MYHRFTNNKDPMSAWGHAMFSEKMDDVAHYGNHHFTLDTSDSVEIESLLDAIENAIEEHGAPDDLDMTSQEVLDELNPSRIANTAQGWDSYEFVRWIWENVLEPRGIVTILTQDGAVTFDASMVLDE